MGAALALVALIGGAASVALVGWHGILLGFVTASLGGSLATVLAALLGAALRHSGDEAAAIAEPVLEGVPAVTGEAGVAG